MPPLRFFHQLLTQQAEPAVTYYVRGTSTNVNGTETFNIQYIKDGASTPDAATTETVQVAADGSWEFEYSGKKIYSLYQFADGNTTLRSISFDDADDFTNLDNCRAAFANCNHLINAVFNKTFENTTNAQGMFYTCTALTSIDMSTATFDNLLIAVRMFTNSTSVVNIDLSNATFANLTDALSMFEGLTSLTTLTMPNATFTNVTTCEQMFYGCTAIASLTLASATFASATTAFQMFRNCSQLATLKMPAATFASVLTTRAMFAFCTALTNVELDSATFATNELIMGMFYSCSHLQTIKMPMATMQSLTTTTDWLGLCAMLTTITVPTNATAIKPTSSSASAPMNTSAAPLTYASMLNVANWVSDLTGYTAHTITFKTSAWNALTAAEQANIDSILTSKNWTRQLA